MTRATLKELREFWGVSQNKIAKELGCSQTTIYLIEGGYQKLKPGQAEHIRRAILRAGR